MFHDDFHMHLSLGFVDSLSEQDYLKRMASKLGQMVLAGDFEQIRAMQLPLVEKVSQLLNSDLDLRLHVQSVSYLDSVFNYCLLTHPQLKSFLNHRLFLYVGVHPWYLSSTPADATSELQLLTSFISQLYPQGVLTGIGEIGLDKLHGAPLPHQISFLRSLLECNSNQWRLPVSLHCVKAHNELLGVLKSVYGKVKAPRTKDLVSAGATKSNSITSICSDSSSHAVDLSSSLSLFSSVSSVCPVSFVSPVDSNNSSSPDSLINSINSTHSTDSTHSSNSISANHFDYSCTLNTSTHTSDTLSLIKLDMQKASLGAGAVSIADTHNHTHDSELLTQPDCSGGGLPPVLPVQTEQPVVPDAPSLAESYGVIHGFNGSVQIAQSYLKLNFYLGLGLHWMRPELAKKLQDLLHGIPNVARHVVLETDHDDQNYPLSQFQAWHKHFAKMIGLLNNDCTLQH